MSTASPTLPTSSPTTASPTVPTSSPTTGTPTTANPTPGNLQPIEQFGIGAGAVALFFVVLLLVMVGVRRYGGGRLS